MRTRHRHTNSWNKVVLSFYYYFLSPLFFFCLNTCINTCLCCKWKDVPRRIGFTHPENRKRVAFVSLHGVAHLHSVLTTNTGESLRSKTNEGSWQNRVSRQSLSCDIALWFLTAGRGFLHHHEQGAAPQHRRPALAELSRGIRPVHESDAKGAAGRQLWSTVFNFFFLFHIEFCWFKAIKLNVFYWD